MQAMLFQIFSEKKCDYVVMLSIILRRRRDSFFFMSQQNIKTPLCLLSRSKVYEK